MKLEATGQKLSVIGLILSVFCGIGFIFSAIGIVLTILNRKENEKTFRNSILLGVFGLIMSIIFLTMTIVCVLLILR